MKELTRPKRRHLAIEVATILKEEIGEGRWSEWLPSERHLLQALGVSRPTLRQALHQLNEAGCIESVPRRGHRIVDAGVSTPPPDQPVMREVGLITPADLYSLPPFVNQVVDRLRVLCTEAGMNLDVFASRRFHTRHPGKVIGRLLRSNPGRAWVLFMADAPVQRWFAEKQLPAVLYGNPYPGLNLPAAAIDYRSLMFHATGTLLGAKHRRIVFLGFHSESAGELESLEGFRDALSKNGAIDAATVRWAEGDEPEHLQRQVADLMRGPEAPTAFVVSRSHHYLTVQTTLAELGLAVPRDVSLICRSYDPFLDFMRPQPAYYRINPDVLAHRLFRLLGLVAEGSAPSEPWSPIIPDFSRGGSVSPQPGV